MHKKKFKKSPYLEHVVPLYLSFPSKLYIRWTFDLLVMYHPDVQSNVALVLEGIQRM